MERGVAPQAPDENGTEVSGTLKEQSAHVATVDNEYDAALQGVTDTGDHLHRELDTAVVHAIRGRTHARDIELRPQREAEQFRKKPAPIKKTEGDPVVAEDVFGLITLGSVIEMQAAPEHLHTGFPNIGIIDGKDQLHLGRKMAQDQRENRERKLLHIPDITAHEPVEVAERADESAESHCCGDGAL